KTAGSVRATTIRYRVMLSRFGSSPVDDGPARSVIISRSSERRSNKCIYGIAALSLLLTSGISADSTLSLENIQAEIDPRVARDDVFRPSSRKYWCGRKRCTLYAR